jgi:hypothetical protein
MRFMISDQKKYFNKKLGSIGFEVLKAVVKKSSQIFLDIKPCSLLEVNQRFGGTYRLILQCRIVSQARNQH